MKLKVEFYNSEKDLKAENYIIAFLKKHFNHSYISSIIVSLKKQDDKSKPCKTEIQLNSVAGTILHTQSRSTDFLLSFDDAVKSLEKKVVKVRA